MKPVNILVTGDIILDHHIYEGDRVHLRDESVPGLTLTVEPGGAALTQRLVVAVFQGRHDELCAAWKLKAELARKNGKDLPKEPIAPARNIALAYDLGNGKGGICPFPNHFISYVEWNRSPRKDKKSVWQVGRGLGFGHIAEPRNPEAGTCFPKSNVNAPKSPDILVLDDAGASFRQQSQQDHWHLPAGARGNRGNSPLPPWIVLKLSGTVAQGSLWKRLEEIGAHQKLVIVVAVETLRLMEAQLNPGLSWEQSAGQLTAELASNPTLQPLKSCRHLIVSFGTDGAVWLDLEKANAPAGILIFDPAHCEGEWSDGVKGNVFGYNSCLVTAVVAELASAFEMGSKPNLPQAVACGLSAMRRLREDGHGPTQLANRPVPGAGFPVTTIAAEINKPTHFFAQAVVPSTADRNGKSLTDWSILAASQGPAADGRPLFGFARQVALRGEAALKGVPHLRIGQLLTASRQEMESLRLVKRMMLGYRDATGRITKPLSVGVFGAPGAGKSFGVCELATGVFGDPGSKSYPGWMEFNLSQFKDPADLIGALHQVRDRVLQGFVPVVFWDEFDSGNYKWLQYLLAPMQDGKFQEGQITHPIGKCVFIFAGGTSPTFDAFGPKPGIPEDEKTFRLAKGPDFKSRLDASLNVLGPNPADLEKPGADIFFPVRRAILLRALLGCGANEQLDMDAGLLTALISVPSFKHGARSLEKLVEPLKSARQAGQPLRRSQMAPASRLTLYVDPSKFYSLCKQAEAFKQDDVVKIIAPAIHKTWRKIAHTQGWKPTYDIPFAELPLDAVRSNEAAARRMPENLALVGLRLEPGLATREKEKSALAHLQLHIELLAEAEHAGWMAHQLSEGWRHGITRDDQHRLHDCLIPYNELREIDRQKDRESVLHYQDFARSVKWKITFS